MTDYSDSFEREIEDIDLTAFDDGFAAAEAPSFDELLDGKYQVRIKTARLTRSQKGDPMIAFDLIVIAGQHTGRHIFKNSVVTDASLPYLKSELKTLGLELAKLSDLAGHLEKLLDMTLDVTKRTRGEFANCYFDRRVELANTVSGQTPDDVPF